jgi:hypothetical protein
VSTPEVLGRLPATRTLPLVLRRLLDQGGVSLLVGKVTGTPDARHVQVEVAGQNVTVPILVGYSPVVGQAAWCLVGSSIVLALGAASGAVTTGAEEWMSGSGAPSGTLGDPGDWYLDSVSGDFYEKTGSTTWTLRGNLKGPTGATGATGSTGSQGPAGTAGSKWYSGGGAPSAATGIVGDWYLNDANGDVYEKTGSSTWTLRDNLTGPTGATGSQGPQGATGQAEAWWSGAGAPASGTGAVGDWYLDTTTGDVHEKTGASTWTLRANIKGPTGATGSQGSTGSQGVAGTPGEKWYTGSGAPSGTTGIVGDWYLDSANGDYYEKTGASAWTVRGNLKGPQGIQGPQGPSGVATTPTGKAHSAVAAWAAADSNSRYFTPALTVDFNSLGGTPFANGVFTAPVTGRYMVGFTLTEMAQGTVSLGILANEAAVLKRITFGTAVGADGSKPGIECWGVYALAANDNLRAFGWHTGGGTAVLTIEVVQLA